MNLHKTDTIGAIVARDVRATSIFSRYNIDFYTAGTRTLEAICVDQHLPLAKLMDEVSSLAESKVDDPDFTAMDVSALSTYILRTHHRFAEHKVLFLRNTIDRMVRVHGNRNEKVAEIKKAFEELAVYLTVHMKHEEFVVFPIIQKACKPRRRGVPSFRDMEDSIVSMFDDHEYEKTLLGKLEALTNQFKVSLSSDAVEKIAYDTMKELDRDLKTHMHLENDILFPKAAALARAWYGRRIQEPGRPRTLTQYHERHMRH